MGLNQVWQAAVDRDYSLKSIIGSGSYGLVVKAKSQRTKEYVAIKHMEIETGYQYALVKVVRELQIMQYLHNAVPKNSGMRQYFASLLDLFCPPEELQRKTVKNLFLVMPLSEKNLGDLVDDSQMEL